MDERAGHTEIDLRERARAAGAPDGVLRDGRADGRADGRGVAGPGEDLIVLAKGVALAGLVWPGRPRWRLPGAVTAGAWAAVVAGTVFGGLAARRHGRDLTPRVAPPAGAQLRTGGPYALSRHPVYAGLLALSTGTAVLRRRPEPLAALAALSAVLHVASLAEERHLRVRFGARYAEYARVTPRLVGLPRRPVSPDRGRRTG